MSSTSTRLHYKTFGLLLAVDRELPFEAAAHDATPEVVLGRGELVWPKRQSALRKLHHVHDFPGGPLLEIFGADEIVVDYGGWLFEFQPGGSAITYAPHGERAALSDDPLNVRFELAVERVVLPLYILFSQPQSLGLHGSAVELGGQGWIFIGESGAGKSTTAHELLERGARLLADDMAIVDLDTASVRPGSPSLRLWRASGETRGALYDLAISGHTPKRWFRLRDELALANRVPLAGLIWLSPSTQPRLDRKWATCYGQQGLADLLRQTFDLTEPTRDWMTGRFRNAHRLAANTPIYKFHFMRSADGSPDHVEAIHDFITSAPGRHSP